MQFSFRKKNIPKNHLFSSFTPGDPLEAMDQSDRVTKLYITSFMQNNFFNLQNNLLEI